MLWRKERAASVWCLLGEKKAEEEWQGGSVEKRVCIVL